MKTQRLCDLLQFSCPQLSLVLWDDLCPVVGSSVLPGPLSPSPILMEPLNVLRSPLALGLIHIYENNFELTQSHFRVQHNNPKTQYRQRGTYIPWERASSRRMHKGQCEWQDMMYNSISHTIPRPCTYSTRGTTHCSSVLSCTTTLLHLPWKVLTV